MSIQEKVQEISRLLTKPPKAESISTINKAREFKQLAAKARSVVGKKPATIESILNQLRAYYQ